MELIASVRDKLGKSVRSLRRKGLIPAELYGHKQKNRHLSVGSRDLIKALKEAGESTVVTLRIGGETHPVLIHDVQRDFLTTEPIHVDFYEVRMDKRTRVRVQLEFVGDSPAVREKGGVLSKGISEIEVEAFPADLPRVVSVPLSGLTEIGQSILVRDVVFPAAVTVLASPETPVVSVLPPARKEVSESPSEVDLDVVKVEAEEKRRKREELKNENSKEKE